jgi:DNA polymerase III subunit alpha
MNLHVHSYYSPLDGMASPSALAVKAKEQGHSFLSLTDHGSLNGWYDLYLACKKMEIKPIYGVEGYITFEGIEGGEGNEGIPHITLLARTLEGRNNIASLMLLGSRKRKRGKPVFTLDDLTQYAKGLIVTTGCPTGIPTRLITGNSFNNPIVTDAGVRSAYAFCEKIASLQMLGATPVVEIVGQPGFKPSELSHDILLSFAKRLGLPHVLTSDAHFANSSDAEAHDLVLRIATDNPYGQVKKIPIPEYQFLCSEKGLVNRAVVMGMKREDAEQGIANAKTIGDMCDELEIASGSYPKYHLVTSGRSAIDLLRAQCKRGVSGEIRKARLEHELSVIESKGIADYFLILNQVVQYIKKKGHVVVCRGSAGGCLVSYAIGLSETDPIEHDLLFERFLDKDRNVMPDIDIDFSPEARKDAVAFLSARYNCCKVLALNYLTRKSALIDTARIAGVHRDSLESALAQCNDDLDEEHELEYLPEEFKQLYKMYPKMGLAENIIGLPRNESKNAAGLIVSSEPIPIPTLIDSHGEEVSTVDKKKIDQLGLMKADLLSVRALGVIENVLRRIGRDPQWLYDQPTDREDVYDFCMKYPAGVFQLDGSVHPVMNKIRRVGEFVPLFTSFYTASALARPGSMNYIPKYCEGKTVGNVVLDSTFGVVVFQEQVMELARIGGGDPQKLRAAVAKSESTQVKEMIRSWGGLGLSDELLDNVVAHGKYSFNKSHCVTYGLVGYWMMYLKYHYTNIFAEEYIKSEISSENTDWILIRRIITELMNIKRREVVPFVPGIESIFTMHCQVVVKNLPPRKQLL